MATIANHVRQVHTEKLTIVVVDVIFRHHGLDDVLSCIYVLTFGILGLKILLTSLPYSFVVKRGLPN